MKCASVLVSVGLIVDNSNGRERLKEFLHQAGCETVMLEQPESIPESTFSMMSMIIIDEWAAHYHGNFLFQVKQRMHPLTLPLLLLLPDKAMARAYLRAGFDDVLRLPLPQEELNARIEVHLRLRKQSELAQIESERRFNTTFDMAPLGIAYSTLDGHFIRTNNKFNDILGYPPSVLEASHFTRVTPVEDVPLTALKLSALLQNPVGAVCTFENRYLCADGTTIWANLSTTLMQDHISAPKYFIIVMEDITKRKQAEITLRESERFVQATMDALAIHICVVDQYGLILAVNQAWRDFGRINGAHADCIYEGINYLQTCEQATGEEAQTAAMVAQGIREVLAGSRSEYELEYPCSTQSENRWFLLKVTRFPDTGPTRAVITHLDITEREHAAARLLHLAYYDVLTSLPNRILFEDRLNQSIIHAGHNNWLVGVLFLDIDRFKLVNDTLGHAAGDKLLQEVSRRLSLCLRDGDTIGRIGGDEFAIILSNLMHEEDSTLVVQKLMAALERPILLNSIETFVTISVGIALYPRDGTTTELLIKNADTAMYMAKESGRNNYQFYLCEMHTRTETKMKLGNSLQRALERKELFLLYQPQVNLDSRRVIGVEALVRWNHPTLGLVSPADFIPLAEENGLIVQIGEWVMRTACEQNKRWQDAGLPAIRVAVNMSARQLMKKDIVEFVRRTLHETGLKACYLELELTESMMMDEAEHTITTLDSLKALGVQISIDDFGTGYSNLGYLERFPLDTLKIDKSFVHRIDCQPQYGVDGSGTIARAIIHLAHSLGLQVIAEGVESEEQLRYLHKYGCNSIQGFYASRPLWPDALALALSHANWTERLERWPDMHNHRDDRIVAEDSS
jgi:diguanylate cyclase (GGDEF)-like protein/PAS domain S-box-containing protein